MNASILPLKLASVILFVSYTTFLFIDGSKKAQSKKNVLITSNILEAETNFGSCDFDCPEDQTGISDGNDEYIIPDYANNGVLVVTGDCGNYTSTQTPAPGTVVSNGNYAISLTAENEVGTSSISCMFNLTVMQGTLSMDEFTKDNVIIYPNKTLDILHISSSINNAEIYSLSGQILHETQETPINISSLNSGIYILKIQKDEKTLLKKFIIN